MPVMGSAAKERAAVRDRIYDFIRDFTAEKGYSPSVREIGDAVGIPSSGSIHQYLGLLAAEGRIKWTPGISRSYRVIEQVEA